MAKTTAKKTVTAVKAVATKPRRPKQDYTIQSVVHALDILEAFKGAAKEDLGVTELSENLGLHKNNVFRLLATLETRGYIEQNKYTGNYRLGIKTFEMGQVFLVQTGLVKQARPVMDEFLARCNETIYLAVLRNEKIVYLDICETTHSVRVANRVGAVLPAYCTSAGKSLLAYLSREELDKIFPKAKFEKFTDNTICEKSELYTHLREVAARGYALDLEELEEEVFCVGAPIMDYTGKAVAAVCVSGPGYRMGMERIIKELLPLTLKAAAEISKRLGYNLPEAVK